MLFATKKISRTCDLRIRTLADGGARFAQLYINREYRFSVHHGDMVDKTAKATPDVSQLWDKNDVAAYCRVTTRTIERWLADGCGPPALRLSPHAVRFRREDVETWADGRGHSERAHRA
jgi:predicted DNA-binding transcriptional regulator AlpA